MKKPDGYVVKLSRIGHPDRASALVLGWDDGSVTLKWYFPFKDGIPGKYETRDRGYLNTMKRQFIIADQRPGGWYISAAERRRLVASEFPWDKEEA